MELKPGYKETEIGLIPEDWEVRRLDEIAEIVMGQSPSSLNYNLRGDGLPLIQGNADIVDRRTVKRIFTTQITKRGKEGDVLMSVRAPVGEISRTLFDVCLGRGVCAIRFSNNFLYHYLIFLEPVWVKHSKGSTFDSVNSADVKAVEVELPSNPKEQTAIATVLSDVDTLLVGLDRLIAKKRELKQATMQQLLTGQTRLPGFKSDWQVTRLGEICSIRNQKILPSNVSIDTLCVDLDQIGQGNGKLLEYSTAQNSKSSKYRFHSGDVLFGRLRSYLRKFWHADQDGICTTEIWPLMANTHLLDSGFLYAIVQSDQFIEASSISYGTHMPRADWEMIKNVEVHLPEIREQHAIAAILSDMDADIAAIETRRQKTQDLKRAMMQELLTGRTRLVVPEVSHV